ncbi:NAD(P)-dependent oxidoreductase [bacterium]|nr:NAD(P)-dependent oxidoreductase [bacterium]
MKALVTGATGFIGSHLVNDLLDRGFEVNITARSSSRLDCLPLTKISTTICDICEPADLRGELKDLDYLFHLAGLTKAYDPRDYYRVNAESVANLLALCAKECRSLKRFVYLGSLAAMRPSEGEPVNENSIPAPVTDYGKSKLEGEKFVRSFQSLLPVTIINPPLVFGPREGDVFLYFKWAKKGIIPLLSNPQMLFSAIYVKDLNRAVIDAAMSEKAIGETYFVANPEAYSLQYFGDLLCRVMGRRCIRIRIPGLLLYPAALTNTLFCSMLKKPALLDLQKLRELTQSWVCSPEKIKNHLGFQPEYSLQDALRETWEWYKATGWL